MSTWRQLQRRSRSEQHRLPHRATSTLLLINAGYVAAITTRISSVRCDRRCGSIHTHCRSGSLTHGLSSLPIGLPVDQTTQQRQDWPAAPASLSSLHSSTACVIREVPFSRLGFLEGFEHMLLAVYFTCLPSAAFERTGFLNGSRCVARSDSESTLAKMTPSRRPHCLPQFS